MTSEELLNEEIDYLYEYARKGLLYFIPLWDSAETLAGKGATRERVREITLELVGALIDRGVQVGEISQQADRDIEPWSEDKGEILNRIDEGIKHRSDPLDFVDICGFRA
ncbi:hypothetical protein ACLIYM_24690 [Streptomyces fenghuangensis]|uniref:hypothetical protein n=1 Tax=Streptomyces sp. ICN903 TaxID=2964654 RepID=UPI001EDC041C|nr:hypothetical protein [Streptomyces sp. ICN903]MCG3042915.1 hypothetical protein [Streptomyces sp. ICN903]